MTELPGNKTYSEAQIVAIGGSPWAKGGKRRVYLNDWQPLAGLNLTAYKSGSIQSADLDGEPVSNGEALRLTASIGQVYWDAADGRIHGSRYEPGSSRGGEMASRLTTGIAAAVTAQGQS